jgi:hypothetical protein
VSQYATGYQLPYASLKFTANAAKGPPAKAGFSELKARLMASEKVPPALKEANSVAKGWGPAGVFTNNVTVHEPTTLL